MQSFDPSPSTGDELIICHGEYKSTYKYEAHTTNAVSSVSVPVPPPKRFGCGIASWTVDPIERLPGTLIKITVGGVFFAR